MEFYFRGKTVNCLKSWHEASIESGRVRAASFTVCRTHRTTQAINVASVGLALLMAFEDIMLRH